MCFTVEDSGANYFCSLIIFSTLIADLQISVILALPGRLYHVCMGSRSFYLACFSVKKGCKEAEKYVNNPFVPPKCQLTTR